jgi:Putative zinc-finger
MRQPGHLENELLVRALDDELSSAERLAFESHMARCEECAARYREFGVTSVHFDSLLATVPVPPVGERRLALERALIRREEAGAQPGKPGRWPRNLALVGAAAASLVFGIFMMPRLHQKSSAGTALSSEPSGPSTFEADGETFTSLPYSNTELPMNTHRVVRMRVAVSSLLDAGVIFEPISAEAASGDRSVLADVLLGMDGEPLGVHVVNTD